MNEWISLTSEFHENFENMVRQKKAQIRFR